MDNEVKKNKGGRPSIFTPELAQTICERIAMGESVRSICKDDGMPSMRTIFTWLLEKDKAEFSHQYERAVNIRAELMFEELNEIADLPDQSESPMRSRLRVDTRKWYLSKIMPKKFGDKVDLTSGGDKINPVPILPLNAIQPNDSDSKDNQPN